MYSVSTRAAVQPTLSEKEIYKQLSIIKECDERIVVLDDRIKNANIRAANAKVNATAYGEKAKKLEASSITKIESGRVMQASGQMKIESGRGMQESGRVMQASGQMKIESGRGMQESGRGMQESGRGMQESGRAMQESGRAMQESARVKMEQVTAMREKECKEIYEEMDGAIEQLVDKKRYIEDLKGKENGKFIEELNCLIKKAGQLKAEANPTASLTPVNEKINIFGQECVDLFTKLENM